MSNDNRILDLKKQIKEKREKLDNIGKFNPLTNCILDIDGVKLNIQVLKKEQLILLACKLQSYKRSAIELSYDLNISSYPVEDWLKDINSRIAILSFKDEEAKLRAMEDKLTTLLSNEKRVELEIDEIENYLK